MDILQVNIEFNWVNKVLLSSKTDIHIEYSINLFKNFMNKWRFDMTKDLKITFNRDFSKNCLEHRKKVLSL
jgi:ribosome-associated toxin RatA of RatAB toxin-antitoxin module